MIDTQKERLLPFSAVPRSMPGEPPSIATVRRWRIRGVRGVKLETLLVGGRRYTSEEALQRFLAGTTAAAETSASPTRT